jgi:LysM repeat protein
MLVTLLRMDASRRREMRRLGTLAAIVALSLSACGPGRLQTSVAYSPPPPPALVVLVDPTSGRMSGQLGQLQDVIRANASPGEAVVVMSLQPSFGKTYVVRSGDSLDSVASAHGLTLSALEAANPQLGPLSGRNWKLIHPDERVLIPDGAAQDALVLVSRAPAGPAPPMLIRLPTAPRNPTDYQRAQYNRTVAADRATNEARVASWRAAAASSVQPWQAQVVAELGRKAGAPVPAAPRPDARILAASLTAGLTTLQGLAGRRMLLVLGGGEIGPGALAPQSLAGINLVIANLADSRAAAAWTAAGNGAGAASVSTLDPALTRLQLAQVINR